MASVPKLKPVEEQVVALMGASSGIGRETALRFARKGGSASAGSAARPGSGLRWPFLVERRDGRVALVYRAPFSALVDEMWEAPEDSLPGGSVLG